MLTAVQGHMKFIKSTSVVGLVTWLAVAGCSSNGDGAGQPDEVAGGQSGTDSSGAYDCDLQDATVSDLGIDEAFNPNWDDCSALDAVAIQQPETAFDCGDLGRLTLSVGAPTAAQRLTGVTYNDTGDPGPGSPCWAMNVVAPSRIVSADNSLLFEPQAFTVKYTCGEAAFEGAALDSRGRSLTIAVTRWLSEAADGSRTFERRLLVMLDTEPYRIDCLAIED